MTPGVLDELLVVAGQLVKKSEPIARLISVDAELHLEQTKNALANSRRRTGSCQSRAFGSESSI